MIIGDTMLENMKGMLEKAKIYKYAIPQFNINNLEWTKFILEQCEKEKSPVILGVSEGAMKYMGGYYVVYGIVSSLIKDLNITIPVALHLDHGSSFESCKKAIDAGFTSVMIDASKESLDRNIEITKEVMLYAQQKNVSVEAEIGCVGEKGDSPLESMYAKVEECIYFAKETGVDFLAPALGSVHGLYKGEPKLDFDRMDQISVKTNLPLVLHGGTGIPNDMIQKSIQNGICKININTELQVAWSKKVRFFINENKDVYDPRKIIKSGEEAIKECIHDKIAILKSGMRV